MKTIKLNHKKTELLLIAIVKLCSEKIRGSIKLLFQKTHKKMLEDYQKVKEGIKSIQDDPLLEEYEKESAIKDLLEMEFTYEINPISMDALLTDSLGNEILIANDVDLLIIEEYLC